MTSQTHSLLGGSVRVWAEPDGPIMLKAVEQSGDPVELNENEAIELADLLSSLARRISE
jgi:hypothetical protein